VALCRPPARPGGAISGSALVSARAPARSARLPVHLHRIRPPGREPRRHPVARTNRAVPGQRPGRKLLQRHQGRAPRRRCLARPHDRPPRRHRVHRLVQGHPSALSPRIPGTRRIRGRRQAKRPSGRSL